MATTDPLTEDSIDILDRKAALEIVALLGANGKLRHTDFRNELLVSPSTLQRRLYEGRDARLWTPTLEDQQDIAVKVWQLTEQGSQIYAQLEEQNLPTIYQRRRKLEQIISSKEDTIIDKIV